jgi:hypothetical protein
VPFHDLTSSTVHERKRQNILQTAQVLDAVMQSVGPYDVVLSIDEMREVRQAFDDDLCIRSETHMMIRAHFMQAAEDLCPQWAAEELILGVCSRDANEILESADTYWKHEEFEEQMPSDSSSVSSSSDMKDISVLVLEAAAAQELKQLPDLTSDFSTPLEPRWEGSSSFFLLEPSSDMGPCQDLDDAPPSVQHVVKHGAVCDGAGEGTTRDLNMKSTFGKRLAAHFEPATRAEREESVKALVARVSAQKVSNDPCSSTSGPGKRG